MTAQEEVAKPLSAGDVVERLCALQSEVANYLDDWSSAADCFCGRGGFWNATSGYGGTFEEGYRNDGKALEFIERVVREAIKTPPQQQEPPK